MDADALNQFIDEPNQKVVRFDLVLLGNFGPRGERHERPVHKIVRVYVDNMR